MYEQTKKVLAERVAPKLAEHGGDVALLSVEDGVVRIKLLGQCANCPSAYLTTEQMILKELQREMTGINQVLVDSCVSQELMDMARKILRHE